MKSKRHSLHPLFYSALFVFLGLSHSAFAGSDEAPSLCFDLSKKNTKLLYPAPTRFAEEGKESKEFGTDELTKRNWSHVDGVVKKPIMSLYQKLLDPMTTRNAKTTRVEMVEVPTTGTLKKEHLSIHVKPVFFITVEWEEEWAYSVLEGSEASPKSILISYQKTNGTSHIRHFCGNILLKKLDDQSTGVFLVENIDADHRSAEDVYNGILVTLRILRE
jgi:hypothetical protein